MGICLNICENTEAKHFNVENVITWACKWNEVMTGNVTICNTLKDTVKP
jgi:hypothetical protein